MSYAGPSGKITDDPEKLLNKVSGDYRVLVNEVTRAIDQATSEVLIVTPYLIPADAGPAFFESLVARGIRVMIFTNSLASTNHVAVHGGYKRYRKPLLKAGVELFEARADAAGELAIDDGETDDIERLTLHTKGIIIDRKTLFIGSLNLDPRSVDINTEMGILVESRDLAETLGSSLDNRVAQIAWQLKLDEKDRIRWHAEIDGGQVIETKEPLSGWWRRFKANASRILPESQL